MHTVIVFRQMLAAFFRLVRFGDLVYNQNKNLQTRENVKQKNIVL